MPPTHRSSPLRAQLTSRLFRRAEQRQGAGSAMKAWRRQHLSRKDTPLPPARPASPLRAQLTSRLFRRAEQRQQAVLASMRATVAHDQARRRRREVLLALLVVVGTAVDGALMYAYLFLKAPAH
jgi:hypothetical protein